MIPWRFHPPALRTAFEGAARAYVRTVARVPDDAWERPGLGTWTVRDLAGHGCRALFTVEQYLTAEGQGRIVAEDPVAYYDVLRMAYAAPDQIDERARAAGRSLGDHPADVVAEAAERVVALVADAADDAPVASPVGVMRLVDYLPGRVLELTVHGTDLALALGLDPDPDPAALEVATVLAAGVAAAGPSAMDLALALTGRRSLPEGFSVV